MSQLEENLTFRLARLEKKLAAYRKLHADELEEIARGVAELQRDVEALTQVSVPTADWPEPDKVQPSRAAEAADRVRWPSLLRING